MNVGIVEPLDAAKIRAALSPKAQEHVSRLEVAKSIESTNTALMQRPIPSAETGEVLLAEFQSAGRGRRGRHWLAASGEAICLSLSWTFPEMPRYISALSLAVAICVLRALDAHGVKGAQVKWPNDVLLGGGKLGGMLIELRSEPKSPVGVVIGMGLNTALGEETLAMIAAAGVPAADLRSLGHLSVSRNALTATLIERCIDGLIEFRREGLRPFIEEWRHADALHGQPVSVHSMDDGAQGIGRGIDLAGAFIVETPQGLKKFVSGDVTVRAVA